MNTRRDFLKLGALFVPAAVAAPRVAYSFLWAPKPDSQLDRLAALYGVPQRAMLESDGSVRARIMQSIADNHRRLQREVQEAWCLSLSAIAISGTVSI